MKIFSKTDAHSSIKLENDQLVESNIRLRKFYRDITNKLNNAKSDYSPEKIKILEDFEKFSKEINDKRQVLLKELNAIQKEIDDRKEIYYGLIAKQDALEERLYKADLKEKKLEERQLFVEQLEKKFQEKAYG